MLRISVLNDLQATRLKLEGKLAHQWVGEARQAWVATRALSGEKKVVVDLYAVSYVDECGSWLLAEMHRTGAELVGSGPMISALIEDIQLANGTMKDKPKCACLEAQIKKELQQ